MSFVVYLTNNIGPTSVGVNTFITIVLLTLITNCDGGAPLATQHTHFRLILCLILRGGRVALVSPNLRRDMLPWSVGGGGVTDLPPDAKLCEMQQNADGLVQLIRAATPDVPNQTPMQQPSKQLLNACPVPPMHIIVTLLAGCQRATSPLHSQGSPTKGTNQKSKPTLGVTMMPHATKRGFKDCPGFLNSTGRLGPKRGRKC